MADRYRIQNSYDTEENWNNLNPVMRQGEIFLAEKANGKVIMKVGTSDKGMTANDCLTIWDEDVYLESKANLEKSLNSITETKQLAQDTLTETNEIIDRANATMTEQVTSATNQANAAKQSADEAREIADSVGKVIYTINNTPPDSAGNINLLDLVYPVGSIYMSTNAANPSTLFGGAWEAYAQGRVLIGAGSGTDSRSETKEFAAGSTGGEYNHVLTVNELASHNHTRGTMNITGEFWHDYRNGQLGGVHGSTNSFSGAFKFGSKKVTSSPTWDNYGDAKSIAFDASKSWSGATSNTGANNTHNNIQPYIACYIFRRVS